MFRKVLFAALLLPAFGFAQQPPTGVEILKWMHDRYADGKWWQTMTFDQKTIFYKNDQPADSATWFEAIRQPGDLRIDFDSLRSGHSLILTRDSAFIIKGGKLAKSYADPNDLGFLLGGWHFLPTEKVVEKLAALRYDATLPVRESGFKNKTCWIIGDSKKGGNEVWIEQKKLLPMRIVRQTGGVNEEIWMENYVRLPRGFCEGKVTFIQDGHVVQVETYNNIAADREMDPTIFDARRYRPRF